MDLPLSVNPAHSTRSSSGVAAERLAEILDIAEDGIVTVNPRQEIVLFNRGASKLFGFAPEEVLGQHLNILIPNTYHAVHQGHMEAFARSPVVSRQMSERGAVMGRHKDGSEFPIEITISRSGAGGDTLFTAIIRDVTERKQYEETILRLNQGLEARVRERTEELAERNLQLLQKNEEIETFVYSVSHDLRSPLVNLEGFSEELALTVRDLRKMLGDDRTPVDVRQKAEAILEGGMMESVQFIRAAMGRLSRIIDALLRLSRAGRVEYHARFVNPTPIARRVVASMHRTVEERGAIVVVDELPPAWADPLAIEQVFANLIGNALVYLDPSRPGRIEVGVHEEESGDEFVTYYVRDNGLGIPAAYLPRLFRAFQRLHADRAQGEGMGLAIVRRVLERVGGRIRAESTPGEGSTFYFTLPRNPRVTLTPDDQ